jgi:plasmid stabilization system protein ParE
MDETPRHEGEISEEFRKLGSNLKEALEAAWNSPERQRLEQEIKAGLREAAETLAGLAGEAAESETGKKLRSEIESLGDRVKSGELEAKIREDVLAAVRSLNAELERARGRRGGTGADAAPKG